MEDQTDNKTATEMETDWDDRGKWDLVGILRNTNLVHNCFVRDYRIVPDDSLGFSLPGPP